MNWDRVEGNWKQITGKVKEQWGKLTEDDLTVINGKQDQLVGRVQERYGIAKDEAARQGKEWADRMHFPPRRLDGTAWIGCLAAKKYTKSVPTGLLLTR